VIRFETSVEPEWAHIERVTARLAAFLEDHRVEPAPSILIVSTELLENAVKYGTTTVAVGYALDVGATIRVRVTNGFDPAAGHPSRLQAELGRLRAFDDPRHAFIARLQEIYEAEPREGGLGLARIAGVPCRLSCRVDSTRDEVEVVAHIDAGEV
jgi:hypothetical protein